MDKIKKIETLLKKWKATKKKAIAKLGPFALTSEELIYKIIGLEAALAILNEPTNKEITAGLEVECWYCHKKTGNGHKCSTCGRVGR